MKVLVIDDQPEIVSSFRDFLKDEEIFGAETSTLAKKLFFSNPDIELVFIDLMLGEEDGIELLRYFKTEFPELVCILMSGYATVSRAVEAVKLGAFDVLEKPISYQKVKLIAAHAQTHRRLEKIASRETAQYQIIGISKAADHLRKQIEKAAQTDFPVLINGPSGSGKEHVAHLIHLKSPRAANELVKINASAVPPDLFESEFFGHEKGAFTGAVSKKKGKFQLADHGSLFLDEIGEMPQTQQAKLLRVLEDHTVTPVGSETPRKVDFRLISATHRDLKQEVRKGNFREDLYFRLGVVEIDVPPLAARREDIPILAEHLMKLCSRDTGAPEKEFTPEALTALSALPFPGNIRELRNKIQRLFVLCDHAVIGVKDLENSERSHFTVVPGDIFSLPQPYTEAKHSLEKRYIETQLAVHQYDIVRTAQSLGMIPHNLVRKMKQLGIR